MPFTSLDSYILVFQTPERGFSGAGVLLQQGVKNSSRQLSAKSAAAIKSMCNKQDAFSAAGRARAKRGRNLGNKSVPSARRVCIPGDRSRGFWNLCKMRFSLSWFIVVQANLLYGRPFCSAHSGGGGGERTFYSFIQLHKLFYRKSCARSFVFVHTEMHLTAAPACGWLRWKLFAFILWLRNKAVWGREREREPPVFYTRPGSFNKLKTCSAKARAALVNLFVLRWQTAVLFAIVTQEFSSNSHAKRT